MSAHAIQRIRERFGLEVTPQELDWLRASTVSDRRNFVRVGPGNTGIWCAEYDGRIMFLAVRDVAVVTVLRLSGLRGSARHRNQRLYERKRGNIKRVKVIGK